MKKMVALVMTFILILLSASAMAITITIDLDKATEAELRQVRDMINAKLGETSDSDTASAEPETDEHTLKYADKVLKAMDFLKKDYEFKNPDSIQLCAVTIRDHTAEENASFYSETSASLQIHIDLTAQNSMGGMTRDKFMAQNWDGKGEFFTVFHDGPNIDVVEPSWNYLRLDVRENGLIVYELDVEYLNSLL